MSALRKSEVSGLAARSDWISNSHRFLRIWRVGSWSNWIIGKVKFKLKAKAGFMSIPILINKSNGSFIWSMRAVWLHVSVGFYRRKIEKRDWRKRDFLQSNFQCSTIKIPKVRIQCSASSLLSLVNSGKTLLTYFPYSDKNLLKNYAKAFDRYWKSRLVEKGY